MSKFCSNKSDSSLEKQDRQLHQARGNLLQKARDDGKRSYDDMHYVEQKILEDFDTGKSKKAKQRFTTPRMKPFRCKLQIND